MSCCVVVVFAGLRLNNAWASGTVLRPFLQPESPLSSRSLVSGFKCKLRDSNSRPPYSRPHALTTRLYTIHCHVVCMWLKLLVEMWKHLKLICCLCRKFHVFKDASYVASFCKQWRANTWEKFPLKPLLQGKYLTSILHSSKLHSTLSKKPPCICFEKISN